MLQRLLIASLVFIWSLPAPALAQDRTSKVRTACGTSPLQLDCGCVAGAYHEATNGMSDVERDAALTLVASVMMSPGTEQDDQYAMTIMRIMDRVQPLILVTDTCKAMGEEPDAPLEDERATVMATCKASDFFMDCSCVTEQYRTAATGLPKDARDYLRAFVGQRLRVETQPAYDAIDPTIAIQYLDAHTKLEDFMDTCSVPTPGGLYAAQHPRNLPAPTMQARADADARDSMRLWCQAQSHQTPAFCACQVQTVSELVPEKPFRFAAESLKALAAVNLGRLSEDERYPTAARAIGASSDDVKQMRRENSELFKGTSEIAQYACTAAIRDIEQSIK